MIVLDDHLLRDHLSGVLPDLGSHGVDGSELATTNLYYARLCKSAAASPTAGKLLADWPADTVRHLVASLVELPDPVVVVPMRELAWTMGVLATEHGLSSLGAEAVAAASHLGAALCVSAADDGPRIRAAAGAVGVRYVTVDQV